MVRCSRCGWDNPEGLGHCENCGAPLTFDVFISYSRKDYADEIGNALPNNMLSKIKDTFKANGISYWFDEEGIYSGDEFASVLTNAIRNSRIFLFISSVNSNQSKWTSNEISTALEFKKTIIPFRLDESPYNDSVMMKIVSFDYIECRDAEKAMNKLLRAIKHHLPNKNSSQQRFVEIPQNVNGATLILDLDGKRTERIMSFASSEKVNKGNSIVSFAPPKTLNEELVSMGTDHLKSADEIMVNISDRKTPIAMLMGPAAVGKTMTLVRLTRYLREQGYTVYPDRSFRSASDIGYERLCNDFQTLINSANAANGTSLLDCMLVKIKNHIGNDILQVVDMAGELYYSEINLIALPPYLVQILSSSNPFVWVILLEPYWRDSTHREMNVRRIREIKSRYFKPQDKILLVCNKIDKLTFNNNNGRMNRTALIKFFSDEYPGLLDLFENHNPITKFIWKYNCSIVPFSTGIYSKTINGGLLYSPSTKDYPQLLWNKITKLLK